jgi:hypothetical protein
LFFAKLTNTVNKNALDVGLERVLKTVLGASIRAL